jgi:hypothetical protein
MRDPLLLQEKVKEFKRGERPNKDIIGYYVSTGYSLFKKQENPLAGGTVDLILTGDFTQQLFVDDIRPSVFQFDSHDEKADGLFDKYGQDLRSINTETFHRLEKEVYSVELAKFIKRQLGQ